jgi:hypothetical protein
MLFHVFRSRRLLLLASLLTIAVAAGWSISRLTAPSPGSPEYQFLRIKAGMSYQEALGLLQYDGAGIRTYSKGTTKDGRTFQLFPSLPPPDEIKECRMDIDDGWDGWSATLFLGEGGVVTGKQFEPYNPIDEALHLLHRAFGHWLMATQQGLHPKRTYILSKIALVTTALLVLSCCGLPPVLTRLTYGRWGFNGDIKRVHPGMTEAEVLQLLSTYAQVVSQDWHQPEVLGVHPSGV